MEGNKTQTILTAAILVVLIGILIAFVVVVFMLKDTLVELEPTLEEAEATMENIHSITDKLVDMLPTMDTETTRETTNLINSVKNLIGNFSR